MRNFFEHQAQARRNTRWLVVAMTAAVLATGLGLYALVIGAEYGARALQPQLSYEPELWHPRLFLGALAGTALVVLVASAFRMLTLRGGGARVAEMLGGRLVSGQARDGLERRLVNVVEEMAIASGVPVPQVFVLDAEAGINAFAAGFSIDDAAVAVTRGTLEKLTRDELQGVVAHEFSHVLNGDMRLNTRLMGSVYGILCIGLCGRLLMRVATSNRSNRSRKGGAGIYLFGIGLGVFLIGWVGELLGKLIKAAVSRQRELLADASAVQFTRNPLGVVGALKKIGGHEIGATIRSPAAEEASHLFFCDLYERLFAHSWLATHPPLSERILRLDPAFDGQFPVVSDDVAEPAQAAPSELGRGQSAAPKWSGAWGGMGELARAPVHGQSRAAQAESARVELAPESLVAQVGTTSQQALERGKQQLAQLPAEVREAAASPFSACALVYALLLSAHEEIAQKQLAGIAGLSGAAFSPETSRLVGFVRPLSRAEQLAVVELVAPALRQLSAEQRMRFTRCVEALVQADRCLSIFEHVVGWMLTDRLAGERDAGGRARPRHKSLASVRKELEVVLSLLAHAGDYDGSGAFSGLSAAASRLQGTPVNLLPASERLLTALGPALAELRALPAELAQQVVDACAHAALADRRVSDDEVTLLRAVCDALRCPLPL